MLLFTVLTAITWAQSGCQYSEGKKYCYNGKDCAGNYNGYCHYENKYAVVLDQCAYNVHECVDPYVYVTTAEQALEVAVGPFGNNDGGYKKRMKDEPVLVKRGVECKSADKYIGKGMELRECALRVYYAGGEYLVFGTGKNAGWCYLERTSSESCPEGWEVDDYDFYKLTEAEYVYNEETALAGEPHESAIGEKKVGNCDEYPEDCETGTAATVAMTSHQPGSVSVVTYGFATVGLGFLVYGAGKYYLGKRDSEMQAIV